MPRSIDLKRLKVFAAEKLGHESALREILLLERDEVPPDEFLAKLPAWLVLLRREGGAAE